jgi:hypothetical protein
MPPSRTWNSFPKTWRGHFWSHDLLVVRQLRDGTNGAAGLVIRVDQPVSKIRLWTAHSVDHDFRDEKWTSRELEIQPGSNQARVDVPSLPLASPHSWRR